MRLLRGPLPAVALAAALSASAPPAGAVDRPVLAIRDDTGSLLATLRLADGGRFALAYRNSLYGSTAEERFVVAGDTRFALVELAADELAVLEEYYAAAGPIERAPPGDAREWRQRLAEPSVHDELHVAATDLGRRTLIAGDQRIELWRLVADGDGATVTIELR